MLEYQTDFGTLKEKYIDATDKKQLCIKISNQQVLDGMVAGWANQDSFYGANTQQVIEWIRYGYRQPGLTLEPPVQPVRKRNRLRYAEEGELQVDLALSGFDYPFLTWGSREIMPGMKVEIHSSFAAMVDSKIISDFYRWVLRALIALEVSGIDLEVTFVEIARGSLISSKENVKTVIRVKKEGEQSDFLSWSPMLSPGGFRHFVFLSNILGADHLGHNISAGLGFGANDKPQWAVDYDPEESVLKFNTPYVPSSFPEEEMEIQLRTVLSEARRTA